MAAPDGQAEHGVFADRRVNHPPRELLRQVLGGLERAAERADILPVNEHARVVRQRPRLRLANRFQVGDAHLRSSALASCPSLRCLEASAHQSSLYGSGPGSRCTLATLSSTFCTASLRQARQRLAHRPSLVPAESLSATFRQSRPSGGLFQLRINVAGVVVFAMAAKAQQLGDDQLRPLPRPRLARPRRPPPSGRRPDRCRPPAVRRIPYPTALSRSERQANCRSVGVE